MPETSVLLCLCNKFSFHVEFSSSITTKDADQRQLIMILNSARSSHHVWGVWWLAQRVKPWERRLKHPYLLYDSRFFLAPPHADLSDLEGYLYPASQPCPLRVIKKEIRVAIHQPKTAKVSSQTQYQAAKNTDITLPDLRRANVSSTSFQGIAYYGHIQTKIKHQAIRPHRSNGLQPYCLLNTLSQALESIVAEKMTYLAKTCHLLSVTQVGVRQSKSTELALELFTELSMSCDDKVANQSSHPAYSS